MKLELISFKICPFVQRSVITLRYKQVPFEITYIDLADPPSWFKEVSPFGKVPVLRLHREAADSPPGGPARHGVCQSGQADPVIFESAVINEYLDEVTEGSLLPDDPVCRAIDRSWIEFGSVLMMDLSGVMHAKSEEHYSKGMKNVSQKLSWLSGILGDGPWFNGANLSLVDFAYAPFFMRAELLGLAQKSYGAKSCRKVAAWAEQLLALPAVQESVLPEFPQLVRDHIIRKAPYAARSLGLVTAE